jgi:enoyl-CoA hydratase
MAAPRWSEAWPVTVNRRASMSETILSEQDGGILRVTINRPDAGNAMTDAMALELTAIVAAAPKTSRMVLLRGAGKDFCVGRQAPPPPAAAPEAMERRRFSDIVFDTYGTIRNSPIPVVCVVQGRALGFGCAVAAVADITIASDAATFQVPEMLHNILPTMVMSALADRATRKALAYLVYSTKPVSAERALSYGIVSDVVPRDALEAEVETLCANILQAPAIATDGVKDYLRHALTMDVPAAIDYARNLHAVVNSSREIRGKR